MSETQKEDVYNSELRPLLDQVKEICARDGIGVLMSFALDFEGEVQHAITSCRLAGHAPGDEYAAPEVLHVAAALMTQKLPPHAVRAICVIAQGEMPGNVAVPDAPHDNGAVAHAAVEDL